MEQQQQQQQPQQQPQQAGGVPGPTGRRLHIAHRRSPSELTPLMSMFSNPGSMFISFLCFQSISPFLSRALLLVLCMRPLLLPLPLPLLLPLLLNNYHDQALTNLCFCVYSGTTCYPTANRAASWPAWCRWAIQSLTATHAQHVTTGGIPVPQPASTAAERPNGPS